MNLPRFFRHTRPTPPTPRLTPHETMIYRAWGFTEAEWSALSWQARAHYRDYYMKVTMP